MIIIYILIKIFSITLYNFYLSLFFQHGDAVLKEYSGMATIQVSTHFYHFFRISKPYISQVMLD